VHLPPQPFRILLLLVKRAGTIVTREEIQQELWDSDTFVGFEQAINVIIRRIRFVLHDDAETPRFLQTHPRRGYRFIAPVERILPEETIPPASAQAAEQVAQEAEQALPATKRIARSTARFAIAGLVVATMLLFSRGPHVVPAAAAPKIVSVAIVPIAIAGGAPSVEARSFATELRGKLTQLRPDRIQIAPSGAPADLRIEAVLHETGDGIQVEAGLMECHSNNQLWRETFQRSGSRDLFALEVAARVLRAVIDLRVPPVPRNDTPRSNVSERALQLYREGQTLRKLPMPQRNCDRAIQLLQQSVAMEPQFAEAWSAIGDIWTERSMFWKGQARRAAIGQAHIALDRALAIDPNYAEAVNDRGLLLMYVDRSYQDAEKDFRAAITADPDYVDARINLAVVLTATAHHEEALSEIRKAQFLDPGSPLPRRLLAFLYLMGRRYDDACTEYRAATLVSPEEVTYWQMLSTSLRASRWDDAAVALSAILGETIVVPHDAKNRGAKLEPFIERLRREIAAHERDYVDPYTLACFHAQTGSIDLALAMLDRAALEHSFDTMFTMVDPRLDPLREDPRFMDRLDRMGLFR
jgi:DNA-binding winged helix-turn-helix (wHTH) protein/tetratricopeptide (TPR) repeat protein